MNRFKKASLVFLSAFLLIQFFRPEQNLSGRMADSHIEKVHEVPDNVKTILEKACYDCHSDNTRYPWYGNIQPAAWFLADHIRKGKEELNFSNFNDYSKRRKKSKFNSMYNQVNDDKMPLDSYILLHKNAKLSKQEKQILLAWFEKMEKEPGNKN